MERRGTSVGGGKEERAREGESASCARERMGRDRLRGRWGTGGKVTEEKPKEESGATHEGGSCTRERGKEREAASTRERERANQRERKRTRGGERARGREGRRRVNRRASERLAEKEAHTPTA